MDDKAQKLSIQKARQKAHEYHEKNYKRKKRVIPSAHATGLADKIPVDEQCDRCTRRRAKMSNLCKYHLSLEKRIAGKEALQ